MSINAAENTVSLELIKELLITKVRKKLNDSYESLPESESTLFYRLIKHPSDCSSKTIRISLLDYFDVYFINLIKCLEEHKDSVSLDDVYIFLDCAIENVCYSLEYNTPDSTKFNIPEISEILKGFQSIFIQQKYSDELFIDVHLATDYIENKKKEVNKVISALNVNPEDSKKKLFELADSISDNSKGKKYRKRIILLDEYLKAYLDDYVTSSDIPWFHIEAYLNCIITHNESWVKTFLRILDRPFSDSNKELYFILSKLRQLFWAI